LTLPLRWRRLRAQGFDSLSAACGELPIVKVARVLIAIEVAVGEGWSDCQPTWPDGAVAAKHVQPSEAQFYSLTPCSLTSNKPSSSETKVFDHVKNFHWLI
jgi:hypothetical protein